MGGIVSGASKALLLLGCALVPSCTLITDVDREDIPEPPQVLFPENDAGTPDAATPAEPDPEVTPDAGGAGDASTPAVPEPGAAPDAGDAGSDAAL